MHYFEFIAEEEIGKENPKIVQFKDLEVGKCYSVLVTTFAGLYRYNMNDLLECTGKYKTIPTIKLIQKINGIISMTGEKLHESQFIEAVRSAEKSTGLKTKFFVGFADINISAYHFYYEFEDKSVTQEQAEKFTTEVDKFLKEANIEYAAKRDSFRVKEPKTHMLQNDSFESYKTQSIKMGLGRDGQFKFNLLMQDEKRHSILKELVK